MDRKIIFPLLSLMLLFGLMPPSASAVQGKGRLNCLLITIDTLRADRLGCYDSRRTFTPHIDSLAQRGVLFTRAFAHTSTTLPSHANILIGTTPLHHGVHENVNFVVPEVMLTLSEHLKNHGYATGAFVGAYPLDSRFGLSQGFDLYDDRYERTRTKDFLNLERRAGMVVESAVSWLGEITEPWFLWVHCFDPHTPYDPPESFKSKFKKNLYDGEVAYVDSVMGTLFRFLEERRLWDSTLVVLTGDHGESLGEHGEETHGFFAYNATVWIPLIVSLPGVSPSRVEQPVSHIDLFPTVCDALRVEWPAGLQGVSLLSSMEGKKLPNRPIYIESLFPYYSHGWAPQRGFILENEKFIDSPIPELYNLEKDSRELKNLANQVKLEGYKSQLDRLIKEFSSPESAQAEERIDRDKLEKLRSLGYAASSGQAKKKEFGPKDDVKTLLPYFNRAQEAWSLYREGSAEEAEAMLRDITVERRDLGTAHVYLARILRETGRQKSALNVLLPGMKVLPENYDLFVEYIKTLLHTGQFDAVIAAVGRAQYREMELDPEIWNNLGVCYAGKGEYEKAVKAYETAFSLDKNYSETLDNLGKAYYALAVQSQDPKKLNQALDFFQKALEVDPDYPAPYKGLGDVYFRQDDFDRAIVCWEKAVELDPNNGSVHFNLGLAYLNKGDRRTALTYLLKVKKLFYRQLSDAQKKKLDELIKICTQ